MAKKIPDAVIDVSLTDIKTNTDEVHYCAGEPADEADVTNHTKGHVHVDTGDFTIGDGDMSGRKITLATQTVTASGDGNVDHVVCIDAGAAIKAITTIESKAFVTSSEYIMEAVDLWEIRDPT